MVFDLAQELIDEDYHRADFISERYTVMLCFVYSLPPFPKLPLSKQLPSKKQLFIFEVFYSTHDHSVWSCDFPGLLKR